MGSSKLYECTNAACPLGDRDNPGRFTGGITAEGLQLLTGAPADQTKEGTDYGAGFCPTCGKKGKAAGTFEPRAGRDPNAKLHEQVAALVADPDNPTTAENAQDALDELVAAKEDA